MFWNKKINKSYSEASTNLLGEDTIHYADSKNLKQLILEGYELNPIVFRCVDLIAKSFASLPIDIKINQGYNENHPVCLLLKNPNHEQGQTEFLVELISFLLLTGNAFVINPNEEEKPVGKQPYMLYNINPDDINITGGELGVSGYKFVNQKRYYRKDKIKGYCGVLHIKEFSGINDFYGMSRLKPCAFAVDTFNESLKWNYNLLLNLGKPGGIISSKTSLDATQYNEAVNQLQKMWKGAKNAGNINVVNGFEYTQTALSPVDMDFRENQLMAARYISQCFGVPSQLIGLPEAQTFSNVESAEKDLYEKTILPLAKIVLGGLERWLKLYYKEEINISVDIDKIIALEPTRKLKAEGIKSLLDTGVISYNEARESLGYEKSEQANTDKLYISAGKLPIDLAGSDITDFVNDYEEEKEGDE